MDVAGAGKSFTGSSTTYDRLQELKDFDESKAGVKGLVDSGITKVPRIFIKPPEEAAAGAEPISGEQFSIPVIDLKDIAGGKRADVVAGVRQAVETVGFFQMVNHGVSVKLLEAMLAAARAFHELPQELKVEYYSREVMKKVRYRSNFDLYKSKYANWRDTLFCMMAPEPLDPQELPSVCRDAIMEYSKQVQILGRLVFELLSEALALKPDHLEGMDCAKGHSIICHYYPTCPEPELTMGTARHSDPDFLTILLQDQIGGLQVLTHNGWVDVPPVPGALVVNIGDLLQLISNDRFKSVEHRVYQQSIEGLEYRWPAFSLFNSTQQQECMAPSRNYYQKITPQFTGKQHSKISLLTITTEDLMANLLSPTLGYNSRKYQRESFQNDQLLIYQMASFTPNFQGYMDLQ